MENRELHPSWRDSNISSILFNSVIVSSAIVATNEIGLLQLIKDKGRVNIVDFCHKGHIQELPLREVIRTLVVFNILVIDEGHVIDGENFNEIFSNKGYFTWLIKGYSYALKNMDLLLEANSLQVSNIQRDGAYIAKAGKDYGHNFVDSYFNKIFNTLDPKVVVDFGCGSANRLISLANNNSTLKGIGIDINAEAIEVARQNIRDANLEDRIEVMCADISNLEKNDRFNKVDLMFCSFMGHDLWPKENCFQVFTNLGKVFPNAINFLLCDTYKSEKVVEAPIFTLGFEVLHAFMGQEIPTYSEWLSLFKDLGWTMNEAVNIGIPHSTIFSLKILPH